ncbi:MAG TPA: transposase [Atribacteraceae bacterium]|nr:transposase [Atribacteraceae bacterium]
MSKFTVGEGIFSYKRNEESIAAEAALDGFYVIRTSVEKERWAPEKAVLSYKSLSRAERAFRTLKGVDLKIRPIHHRAEDRVRAHIFLCMLAYYTEWHLREAWRSLLFEDEYPSTVSRRCCLNWPW